MEITKGVKIGAIVVGGIALAFAAGYVIFSYFSRNGEEIQNNLVTEQPPVNTENESDTEGIIPGSVAGATDYSESEGIVPNTGAGATGSTDNSNALKGGVLGDSNDNGITPNNTTPQRTTITPEMRQADYEEEDTSDSEVFLLGNPEIEEEDDYVQYTYTFEFNSDARKRYKDGFTYSIDAQTCDEKKFFTSSSYDYEGTINNVDEEVEIKVRVKDDYIDDANDLENSEYKFDGKRYVVEGDIEVPVCD